MDNMTITMLTSSWLKFSDMSLFRVCVVVCTQTSNFNIFDPKRWSPFDVYWHVLCRKVLVNKTNLVHNSFFVCLFLFSTCFGQLCAHHQEKRTVPIWHLVIVTLSGWLSGMLEWNEWISFHPAFQMVIHTQWWQIPGVVLIQLFVLMMGR
jgi:hypothetical protein